MAASANLLGTRIRQARRAMPQENARRVSQEAFASKLGVHWVTVSSWERGKYPPSLENLVAIAQLTGKPLEFFVSEDGSGEAGDEDEEEAALHAAVDALVGTLVARVRALSTRDASDELTRERVRKHLAEVAGGESA